MDEPLLDWRGNEIKVGSVIIYAVSSGSRVVLNEAVVKEILPNTGYEAKYRPNKIIAQPINSHSKGRFKKFVWDDKNHVDAAKRWHYEEVEGKPVRLTALERVVVIG